MGYGVGAVQSAPINSFFSLTMLLCTKAYPFSPLDPQKKASVYINSDKKS